MKSESFQRGFLLLLLAVISLAFLFMVRNFLITLLFAAMFAGLFRPMYLLFVDWTRGRTQAAAGLSILVFVLLVVLPLFSFMGLVASQAVKVTEAVAPWVQENLRSREDLNHNLERIPGYRHVRPYREQILSRVGGAVSSVGNFFFKSATAITAGTFLFFVHFAIMLYAMFFFFIDGPDILKKVLYYMPLDAQDEKKLLRGFLSMARASIKGIAVIGAVQGALAGLAFWAAGIPSALFWGTLMAVLSVIPNVGSAIVWVPGCVYLFLKGNTVAAILVFAWCAIVVGSADNVLRPILIGKGTQVPQLMVLISTLGGLAMFGWSGFILGPALALLFLMIWEIYGTAFKDVLPKIDNF